MRVSLYKPLLQTENKVRQVRMSLYKPLLQIEVKAKQVRMSLYKPLLQTENKVRQVRISLYKTTPNWKQGETGKDETTSLSYKLKKSPVLL